MVIKRYQQGVVRDNDKFTGKRSSIQRKKKRCFVRVDITHQRPNPLQTLVYFMLR